MKHILYFYTLSFKKKQKKFNHLLVRRFRLTFLKGFILLLLSFQFQSPHSPFDILHISPFPLPLNLPDFWKIRTANNPSRVHESAADITPLCRHSAHVCAQLAPNSPLCTHTCARRQAVRDGKLVRLFWKKEEMIVKKKKLF